MSASLRVFAPLLAALAVWPAAALGQPIAATKFEPAIGLGDPAPEAPGAYARAAEVRVAVEPAPAHAPSPYSLVPFAGPAPGAYLAAPEPLADTAAGVSVGRVGAELLGATLGTVAAVGVGYVAYAQERCGRGDPYGDFDLCGLSSIMLGVSSYFFTMPLGVLVAGNLGGGNRGFGWTFLGGALGTAVGFGFTSVAYNSAAGGGGAFALLGALMSFAGAIAGYELSSDDNWRGDHMAPLPAAVQVMPSLGLTPDGKGLALGLSGVM